MPVVIVILFLNEDTVNYL